MVSLKTILITYIVGGITLLPLLIIGFVAVIWYTSPEVAQASTPVGKDGQDRKDGPAELDAATADIKKKHKTSTRVYRCGWVTVRRTFEPVADSSNDAGYMTMMASSYRSFVDSRSKDPRRSRPRDKYYAVLKDTVLFLYEDEQENDCYAAIKLPLHEVTIFPEDLIEGELFMKKNAIRLRPIAKAGIDAKDEVPSLILRPLTASNGAGAASTGVIPDVNDTQQPWFIFPLINHDKEDWYHSFVSASRIPEPDEMAEDANMFDSDDMGNLVDTIDDQPDPISTRWLNAMMGRLFYSVYRTSAVEDYIVRKIMRKLTKVNKPDFLGDIEVKEVDVGNTTPFFSKPMLKELTAEGDASMEVHVKYAGDFRISISTVATLNLGQRFKSYSVKLVLAVILKDLEGDLLFKIKRPPSNRVWFGFTSPPKLGLRIEPVVSTRQIKWSMVTKPIESRLRELVAESIVLPHMDDIAFFDTRPYVQRGGIYGECARKASNLQGDASEGMEPALAIEESNIMPGVPNMKLGDPKNSTDEALRHRSSAARKSSGAESITSTRSMPAAVPSEADKAPGFGITSFGTTTSLDRDFANNKAKTQDHNRKKSWFSSTAPLNTLHATESDSALPLSSNTSLDQHIATKPLAASTHSADEKVPNPSTPNQSEASAHRESSDAAIDKLRNILDSRKISTGTELTTKKHSGKTHLPALIPPRPSSEPAQTASSAPTLHETSSGSSTSTTNEQSTTTEHHDNVKMPMSLSEDTGTSPLLQRKSNKSVSSSHSTGSSNAEYPQTSEVASVASLDDISSAASIHSNSSASASNIAILQNWKTKATDKQAIQASVNQAKDAMSKWGTKWHAFRKAQQAAAEGLEEDTILSADSQGSALSTSKVGSNNLHPTATRSAGPSLEGSVTPPQSRSRSSSIISASPTGLFHPSIATTTTSLSTTHGDGVNEQSFKPVHRVPPPSAVPTHPAVGVEAVVQPPPPPPVRKTYKPAPMMSIPGIDDSRRFHASSADLQGASASPPPLPTRKPPSPAADAILPSPKRIPPPMLIDETPLLPKAEQDGIAEKPATDLERDGKGTTASNSSEAPPLPMRTTPPFPAEDLVQPDLSSTAGFNPAPQAPHPMGVHSAATETFPALVLQPPTPSPSGHESVGL